MNKIDRIMMSMAMEPDKVEEMAETSFAEKIGDFMLEHGVPIEKFELLSDLYVSGFLSGWSGALTKASEVFNA